MYQEMIVPTVEAAQYRARDPGKPQTLHVETDHLLVEGKKYATLGTAVCELHCQEISWTPKVFPHDLTFFVY